MIKDDIVDAGLKVLIEHGLDNWTIDAVAAQAKCAKGLVHYHHGTKARLLHQVARRLADQRFDRRLRALTRSTGARDRRVGVGGGTGGVDALWKVLRSDAASGASAAWFGVLGTRPASEPPLVYDDTRLGEFARAVARALELPSIDPVQARALRAALDGLEAELLAGTPPDTVRDTYHGAWLALLPA